MLLVLAWQWIRGKLVLFVDNLEGTHDVMGTVGFNARALGSEYNHQTFLEAS